MMQEAEERQRLAPKPPKRRSYDESTDEPAQLIEDEPVDIEENTPADDNEPVEGGGEDETTPAFEE